MYVGNNRAAIRDALLASWSAEYAAAGAPLPLLIAPGSDAYLWASAFAVQIEGLEAQAEAVARDILPDQASEEALARHAYCDDVPRGAGTRARHSVTVTGPSLAAALPIPATARLAYSDGTLYTIDDSTVTLSGGKPTGTISVTAVDFGAAGTRATGDVLTWVSTPTGLNPTGIVAATPVRVVGTDVESISSWAQRIVESRRERPGSGNRSQWREWVRAYTATDIATAYVYPLLEPPASYPGAGTPDTLGCVTVVAVGPVQGDSLVNTRIVPSDDGSTRTAGELLSRIVDYVEGDRNAAGVVTGTGTQLRPVTLPVSNYSIEAINAASQNVVLSVTPNDASDFPFVGALTIAASSPTVLVVAGNHEDKEGMRVLVHPSTPTERGGYRAVTLGPGVFAAGETTFDQTASPVGTPSGSAYPCPPNWETIRLAVFAYFDALGPGDTTPASRWPAEDTEARATLYRTALAAQVIGLTGSTGVLSCTVTTPAADVTPAAKTVVTLGTLRVVPA